MRKLIMGLGVVSLLAACASEPVKDGLATSSTDATGSSTGASTDAGTSSTAGMPAQMSVYFPFDVDAVQAGDRSVVSAHGAFLAKNKNAKVRIEGNCDERGSGEYNLGLGQRRADNVRQALMLAGADASQIETVSYGEEKPRCSDHNEACWSQNRRADIVYTSK